MTKKAQQQQESTKERILKRLHRCQLISDLIMEYLTSEKFQKMEEDSRIDDARILQKHYDDVWATM